MGCLSKAGFVRLMQGLGCIYAIVGLLFFFFTDRVVDLLNFVPRRFGFLSVMPYAHESFWVVLAFSMMVMIVCLSFLSARTPQTKGYTLVHVLSKLTTSVGFLWVFLFRAPYFAYLVGFLTDLIIAALVFVAYRSLPDGQWAETL